MYLSDVHFQFALDRSHRFEMAATEYRSIARADAAPPGRPAPNALCVTGTGDLHRLR